MRISALDAARAIPEKPLGAVRRRLTDEHELDIYLLNDPTSRVLALEIHLLPRGLRLPEVEVGDILEVTLLEQSGVLRIALLEANYSDVFLVLVDDLVDSIISRPGLDAGAKAVLLRLRRWERLLEASSNGISLSSQKGLIGELKVLATAGNAIGMANALTAWQGPEGGTRDFDFGETGIEVKTTTGKGLLTVRISSERQLEVEAIERLFLWCISLEKSDNGETINDVIISIQSLIGNDDELNEVFLRKLKLVGYVTSDSAKYKSRFSIHGEYVYQILEGFPRITSAQVPNCVFSVGYSIDLEACEQWLCTNQVIWEGSAHE
jgi:hypothetical protein